VISARRRFFSDSTFGILVSASNFSNVSREERWLLTRVGSCDLIRDSSHDIYIRSKFFPLARLIIIVSKSFTASLFAIASRLALQMSISQVVRFTDRRAIATFFNVQCLLPTRKETSRETLSDLLAACSLHYYTRCVFRRHAFPALSFGVFVSRRAASLQRVTYTPVDSCTFIELFTHRFNEIGWCD